MAAVLTKTVQVASPAQHLMNPTEPPQVLVGTGIGFAVRRVMLAVRPAKSGRHLRLMPGEAVLIRKALYWLATAVDESGITSSGYTYSICTNW